MSLAVYEILEAVGHFRVKSVVSLATCFLNQSDLYAVGYGFITGGKVALGALRPGLGDYTASACSVELIGHRVSSPSAIGSSCHRRLSGGLCGEKHFFTYVFVRGRPKRSACLVASAKRGSALRSIVGGSVVFHGHGSMRSAGFDNL